jgi:ABC-2 type transport system permease protein
MNTFGVLYRQHLRRDRWQVPIWLVGIFLLAAFSVASVTNTYGSAAARVELIRLAIGTRAILLARGLPQGTTLADVTFFAIFSALALLAALMSTFLAVRHTRAEEESGRAELLDATPAGRIMPTVVTIVHGGVASILAGIAVALGFIVGGLPVDGSFVAGAATTGTALAFLGVGLLTSQLMSTSRGANGTAAAAAVLAYFLRGIGDATGTVDPDGVHMTAGWISWVSPIGWGENMAAYDRNRWWPFLLLLAFSAVLVAIVFALQGQRDIGSSLVRQREGRPSAAGGLAGPFGLAWRLQWPTVLGWAAGGAATGLLAGSLGGLVNSALLNDPNMGSFRNALRAIGQIGTGPLQQVFIAAIFAVVGVLSAACATQMVVRLRQEEAAGTAELMLATPLSRIRWLLEFVLVGAIAVVVVLAAAGLASGLSALAAGGYSTVVNDSLKAAAAQIPVSFVYLGVLALVFVLWPGGSIAISWTALGVGAFVGIFGGFIGLPDWALKLSPFTHTPVTIGPSTDWSGGVWMIVIAVAATAVAALLVRRRDFAIA